jgi:branched-chain amino acid transport system permease protein
VGGALAVVFAIAISYPCFRLQGPFFCLATIAFAEVMRILATHFREVTQGGVGLTIPFRPGLSNFLFADKAAYAVIAYIFLLVMIGVSLLIERARAGYYLSALRDDEGAAEATGINTSWLKLWVMMISAFCTAAAGTFYAQYLTFIDPDIVFSSAFPSIWPCSPSSGEWGRSSGPSWGPSSLRLSTLFCGDGWEGSTPGWDSSSTVSS